MESNLGATDSIIVVYFSYETNCQSVRCVVWVAFLDINLATFVIQTASASIAVGSHVWVEDSEVAWIDGKVLEINGEGIKVICTSGKAVSIGFCFCTCNI